MLCLNAHSKRFTRVLVKYLIIGTTFKLTPSKMWFLLLLLLLRPIVTIEVIARRVQ